MSSYIMTLRNNHAHFSLVNKTGEKHDNWKKPDRYKWTHYKFLNQLIRFMISRGWKIEHDKRVHKLIRCDFWYGKKGNLEVNIHRYPRGFDFEFFQNIVFENSHGGRFDFDKFIKMPYLVKLVYLNETKHMMKFLKSIVPDLLDETEPEYKLASDKVKFDFVKSWHHPQKSMEEFELSDLDGTTTEGSCNHIDRDGNVIYNGQVKYFRDIWSGRLYRGKSYHNINNMWWVILNNSEYRNVADFELFDPTPEDFAVRRKKKEVKPKEYLLKMEQLSAIRTKDLIGELKRRGIKVAV